MCELCELNPRLNFPSCQKKVICLFPTFYFSAHWLCPRCDLPILYGDLHCKLELLDILYGDPECDLDTLFSQIFAVFDILNGEPGFPACPWKTYPFPPFFFSRMRYTSQWHWSPWGFRAWATLSYNYLETFNIGCVGNKGGGHMGIQNGCHFKFNLYIHVSWLLGRLGA